ncbi:hypothetical protein ACFVJH_23785 [Streptomyces decoyicus]|uniref:hypothetical protein n=1 Tax=Streptomyces decoyicus TaxID=249567 RepID=UPI00363903E6
MKKRAHGLAAATALMTGLAVVASAGTANATTKKSYPGGTVSFVSKGDVLTVKDNRKDGYVFQVWVYKTVDDLGNEESVALCRASGGYRVKKVCDLNLTEGRRYHFKASIWNGEAVPSVGDFYVRA